MNLDYFKEHKFISAILIVLIICVCRMCMYQRVVKYNQVIIINRITNTYYVQHNSHNPNYIHWWQRPINWYKQVKANKTSKNRDQLKTKEPDENFKRMYEEDFGVPYSN